MAKKINKTKRWVPTIGAKLGPQEYALRQILKIGINSVETLFKHVACDGKPAGYAKMFDLRQKQQRIGAIAARHNRKVKSPHIVKGEKAGTYRLQRVR